MKNMDKKELEKKVTPVDEYLHCLSYCDIYSKGIDEDCEIICMERHLKTNYW
tara:strand:- start:1584 stop:1739 length:156 start_codon:yes stop_codon:yes gene_type:complete